MKRPSSVQTVSALALIGLLTLTGCSSDDKSNGSAADGKANATSPMDEYFADLYGDQSQEDMDQQQVKIEELTASCMAEKGFTYAPMNTSGNTTNFDSADMEDQNTKEWVTANGYGMFTNMEPTEPTTDESADAWVDPNQDYIESLSESGKEAFYAALYGEMDETVYEEGDEMPEYDWTKSGCQGYANHEVWGDQDTDLQDEFQPLMDAMNELWEAQTSDPKIKALETGWSSCMADAGFTFKTPEDAYQSVNDAGSALYGWTEDYDPEAPPAEPASDEVDALKALEIKTALADFNCKQEVKWDETNNEVRFALEEQFMKDHKEELAAYKQAMKEQKK